MKWTVGQVDQYLQAKEYYDTAIVPLIPIDWKNDPKENVSNGQFISAVTDAIEKHFIGRVFEMPAFTYMKEEGDSLVERLRTWDLHLSQNGFPYTIYITSDSEWKLAEDELPGLFIWIPAISLDGMDKNHQKKVITHQAKQTFSLITNKWNSEVLKET